MRQAAFKNIKKGSIKYMKILFVCSGNTCRSPMAQAIFQKLAAENNIDVECRSAGIATFTGSPASDNSITALNEIGIDISDFRSTSITSLLPTLSEFDLFVPMTYSHAMALLQIGVEKKKIYLFESDVSDPYGGDLNVYRATRDELAEKLETFADFVENIKKNK